MKFKISIADGGRYSHSWHLNGAESMPAKITVVPWCWTAQREWQWWNVPLWSNGVGKMIRYTYGLNLAGKFKSSASNCRSSWYFLFRVPPTPFFLQRKNAESECLTESTKLNWFQSLCLETWTASDVTYFGKTKSFGVMYSTVVYVAPVLSSVNLLSANSVLI